MSEPVVYKESRAHKILDLLKIRPCTHQEIAEYLGVDEKVIEHDFQELKRKKISGSRKSPPRNTTKIRPGVSRVLSYMSKRQGNNYLDSKFIDIYKPLIVLKDGVWLITKYGRHALKEVEKR